MGIELKDDELTVVYEALTRLLPDKPWLKWVTGLEHQISEAPAVKSFLGQQNVLANGLSAFECHGVAPPNSDSWNATHQAMIFAAQIVHACRESTPESAEKLCGRVREVVSNPGGMRELQFELNVATHLSRQGCEITWMEEGGGKETFDMLAMVPEVGAVEVKCKSLSADRGESLREYYMLINHLLPLVEPKLPPLERHFFGVSFTFNCKIPESSRTRTQLAFELAKAVGLGKSRLAKICTIDLRLGNLQSVQYALSVDVLDAIANDFLGSNPGHRVIKHLGEQGYLAIDIRSQVPSKFDVALESAAKAAVREQMSGTRPGCLVVRMERQSGPAQESISAQEFSSLARRAETLMANPDYAHLAAVVFVSTLSLEHADESLKNEQSKAYVFESPMGNYPKLGLGRVFGTAAKGIVEFKPGQATSEWPV